MARSAAAWRSPFLRALPRPRCASSGFPFWAWLTAFFTRRRVAAGALRSSFLPPPRVGGVLIERLPGLVPALADGLALRGETPGSRRLGEGRRPLAGRRVGEIAEDRLGVGLVLRGLDAQPFLLAERLLMARAGRGGLDRVGLLQEGFRHGDRRQLARVASGFSGGPPPRLSPRA